MVPRALGRNVAANLLNGIVGSGIALLYVPVILDGVGLAGFGVWTLAQTALIYVATAETGIGPSIMRFAAVAFGASDRPQLVRLLWSTLVIYCALGLLILAAALVLAAPIVDAFDVPAGLYDGAVSTLKLMGPAMVLALVAAGLGNLQQGLERFVAFAVTNAVAALVFLATVIVLFDDTAELTDLAWAAIAQQGALAALRLWTLRDVVVAHRPGVVSRGDARQIVGFSLRLQVSVLSTLVNNQTDKVVIGLVSSTRTLGEAGIAAQVADASRLIAGAALGPIVSRMAALHGSGDEPGLAALFARFNRLWMFTVLGVTVIGVGAIYPIITGWLGDGHEDAALFAGFLVAAYGANMLSGAGTSYLRAIGRPGLEARYGMVLVLCNLALTPPLGILLGPVGVVGATLLTYVAGTGWFLWRLHALVPAIPQRAGAVAARAVAGAAVAGAAALGWGLVMLGVFPAGLCLAPVLAGTGVVFVLYLSWVTRVAPTPANVRALVG